MKKDPTAELQVGIAVWGQRILFSICSLIRGVKSQFHQLGTAPLQGIRREIFFRIYKTLGKKLGWPRVESGLTRVGSG